MCGKETAGFDAADSQLFRGKVFVLCRTNRTTADILGFADELLACIGAIPLFMTAVAHDATVALTSHLPYLLAASLMQQAARQAADGEQIWDVSASGFRDMIRLSGTDPDVMLDILLTNRAHILAHLEAYQANLGLILEALKGGDRDVLGRWLQLAQAGHRTYLTERGKANSGGQS